MSETIPPAAFQQDITATEADMDELGHVNNVVYLAWIQDVAKAHWFAVAKPEETAVQTWVAVRHADSNGRELGHAALAVIESLPPPQTRFRYNGPVLSGATLGTWSHVQLEPSDMSRLTRWGLEHWSVELPYRPDLPSLDAAGADLARLESEEAAAHQRQDQTAARDARALAERMTRLVTASSTCRPVARFRCRSGSFGWEMPAGSLWKGSITNGFSTACVSNSHLAPFCWRPWRTAPGPPTCRLVTRTARESTRNRLPCSRPDLSKDVRDSIATRIASMD